MLSDEDESADEKENSEVNEDNSGNLLDEGAADDNEKQKQDFEWLKMAAVDESDETKMNSIKEKLIATMGFRLQLIQNAEITSIRFNLLESFPYFFVCPQLVWNFVFISFNLNYYTKPFVWFSLQVLFDFQHRFPNCLHGAFLEKWPSYGPQLKNILHAQYKKQVFTTGWPQQTESLFILLRLLPAKPGARISVAVFKESIEKFIVFRKVYRCI